MIFLLEDDSSIRELTVYALTESGLPARGFDRPSAFFDALRQQMPSLVLLDVMLPEQDGTTVLARLRSTPAYRSLPVIMLTARDSEFDKVSALNAGADDYVTKPFGVLELIARVRAVLRRSENRASREEVYAIGPLSLSVPKRTLLLGEQSVPLTCKEFDLLTYLLRNRGVVLTRDQILSEVWGYDFDGESRTVDVHIRSLRSKLGEQSGLLETVRGVGYRIGL